MSLLSFNLRTAATLLFLLQGVVASGTGGGAVATATSGGSTVTSVSGGGSGVLSIGDIGGLSIGNANTFFETALPGLLSGRRRTYRRRFSTFGSLGYTNLCFDQEGFCDEAVGIVDGDEAVAAVACTAAQRALSRTHIVFGIQARLVVREGPFGNINRIRLNSSTSTGAMAIAFSESVAGAAAASYVDVEAASGRAAQIGNLVIAKALAAAGANALAVSLATAKATSVGGASAAAETQATVLVNGDRISRFRGSLLSFVGAFAGTSSETETKAVATASADAFSFAFVRLLGASGLDVDEGWAASLAKAFSSSFSAAIAKVSLYSYVSASVRDTPQGTRLRLTGGIDSNGVVGAYCL